MPKEFAIKMAPTDEIIFYMYTFSPYSRKVTQYLTLRDIPLTTGEQPPVMPRPDLATIVVKYRRISVDYTAQTTS